VVVFAFFTLISSLGGDRLFGEGDSAAASIFAPEPAHNAEELEIFNTVQKTLDFSAVGSIIRT
jgi:hypothetical protein